MQPSDKELDKLVKEAAEQVQATGAPDWEGMQALLDQHLPVKKNRGRKTFIILFSLLLLALVSGSYFYFAYQNTTAHKPTPAKQIADAKTSTLLTENNKVSGKTILQSPVQVHQEEKDTPVNSNSTTYLKRNAVDEKYSAKKKIIPIATKTNMDAIDDASIAKSSTPSLPSTNINQGEIKVTTSTVTTGDEEKITTSLTEKELHDTTKLDKLIAIDSVQKTSGKNKSQFKSNKNRFTISLLYAPELTTVNWTNIDKPGSNYGLLIGYSLSNKLSLQTGVAVSRKNYTANGADFITHYPAPASYKLTTVNGYCNMYELPLNLRLQISGSKKINSYVMGGISSYFMTKEFYNLLYTSATGAYNWEDREDTQRNYWLGLVTVGAGFEKNISTQLTFGVNPFLKIPLKGMGSGQLKLLSTGINFTLSYQPHFGK